MISIVIRKRPTLLYPYTSKYLTVQFGRKVNATFCFKFFCSYLQSRSLPFVKEYSTIQLVGKSNFVTYHRTYVKRLFFKDRDKKLLNYKSDVVGSSFIYFEAEFQSIFLPTAFNFENKRYHTSPKMLVDGLRLSWELNMKPEDLATKVDDLISKCRTVYDRVGAIKDEDVTYENVLKALADVECDYSSERYLLDFPQQVASDKALRDASTEADRKLQAFDVEVNMRQDVFDKLLVLDKKAENLQPEHKRFLERLIKLGKRNGLHLPKDVQDQMKTLKSRMNDLCIEFNKNLNEENTVLEFSNEELDGLPEDFIENLAKSSDTGKRKVTLKYPHYFPIMRKAKNPETRRLLELAFNTQCMEENTPILEELVTLRQKQAELLGFPTHASYITDLRMAKTAKNVSKFLHELSQKLDPLWQKEKKCLLELKETECKERNIPYDEKLNFWDLRYYTTMVEELKYAVDQSKLREYFPLHIVTKGLLEIYQELLGLRFTEIENPKVWHPDVQMFSVKDGSDGHLLGYFFLDLFPREGKYGHAAVFELQPGCLLPDGSRQVSVCAMVANFTKPTSEKPSLLDHNEVVTFFHEFGHVMHQICAQAQLAHFNGTNVERDFVEAPSQMLENWCWEPIPLKRMSGHYQNGSALPQDMLEALIKSRLANTGYHNLRQVILALFDHKIHTSKEADTKKVFSQIHRDLLGIIPSEDTNFAAHFGHLAGGYDAQYYGYLWSEVFSMDMFYSRFKKDNVMNPVIGKEYRDKILRPGGSRDAADMLKDFLGREPTQDAFLISKGLKV